MTVPVVTELDIAELAAIAPDLDFADAERRAVLLESGSRDINAAPGSGKTTVLAAKLLLLGRKWTHARKGICVLSHTNVAREEIQRRLGASADGNQLLAYPHFIGTIHALVNQFLALPYMRSNGLEVDVIDDEVFSHRALAIACANWKFRAYMGKNAGVAPMVAGLVYRGPNLEVGSEGGSLPGPTAATRPFILDIKQKLTSQGIFRYADMFAYAERLLMTSPHLRDRLSRRFPVVFIDEMQDTSWEQERLLQLMFDDSVVIQRFGDVNQRILGNNEGAENLTFPKVDALPISTSKRFGPAIARAVAGVQLTGTPVVGENADQHAPMLLTYSTAQVGKAIPTFGMEVLKRFDDVALRSGAVKALCARKQGDAKKELPGRTLLDYWPSIGAEAKPAGPRFERFWSLVSGTGYSLQAAGTMAARAGDIRRAILMVLRAAGAEATKGLKDGQHLLRRLGDSGFDTKKIRLLMRDLAVAGDKATTEAGRKEVPRMLFDPLQSLLPVEMTPEQFVRMSVFEEPEAPSVGEAMGSVCSIEHCDRRVDVQIGSLASMKGETHLATLVLESYGWPGKRFDIKEALPVISQLSVRDPKLKESHLSQYRNLYVGMSRPTSFLCLAANAERVSDECKAALASLGWVVEHIG
ncbi:UvrD-helicase domain-containing protein [Cupriavidus metallidurans]|uniref:UvrD-helicase domain-containing protein n=1 Tax=Cupriavidus metallidurans TaxID=119219 RepID=UPI001CCC898D|nr:UvrD-helicase domain-containing protein [Cupriavidus metallidurans]UBM09989.1 UvrD-helicase domain-containing protein [Cupriavidus metallidurans]